MTRCLRLCTALVLAAPGVALGWNPLDRTGACPAGEFFADETVHVYVHNDGTSGITATEYADSIADLQAVIDALNAIEGTDLVLDYRGDDALSMTYQSWVDLDPGVPEIHVWFDDLPSGLVGRVARQMPTPFTCVYDEAHLQFDDAASFWWGEPESHGLDYYEAGDRLFTVSPAPQSFRIAAMHEMVHTLGLMHNFLGLTMMNYGEQPWANRSAGSKLQPLADEISGIRDLYPGWSSGDVWGMQVANVWVDPNSPNLPFNWPSKFLCSPSLGQTWTDEFNHQSDDGYEHCGMTPMQNEGSTLVCPGDLVKTRVALSHYSTSSQDILWDAWFSLDDVLGPGDLQSPSLYLLPGADRERSYMSTRPIEVPDAVITGATYHIIRRATGLQAGTDWIPLRETVQVRPACN